MTISSERLHEIARACVDRLGDIFRDHHAYAGSDADHSDPREVATAAIEEALREAMLDARESVQRDSLLRSEYETLISELPGEPTENQIIGTLVANGDWTANGARAVLHLAQTYGSFILREALVLAEVLNIEDGEAGL